MRNSIKWLTAGLVALAAGACSYDNGLDNVSPQTSPSKPSGGGSTGKGAYGVTIGASSYDEPATRTEYDGVTYKWSPNDKVGFYMVPMGGSVPMVSNTPLVSQNRTPDRYTEFDGGLTRTEIGRIDPEARYDYYSYYPYRSEGAGFPNVSFDIPATMNLTPNDFPEEYGFMYGEKVTTPEGEKPLTWLVDGQQHYGEYIGIKYKHAFAFLEVHLALNLMSQPVDRVVVTCTDGSPMSGTARINITNGNIAFDSEGASNSITVNIGGAGMDIRSATDYDRIYIPINPALAGKEFKFDFRSKTDARNGHSETKTGGALQAGMKHKAGFILPFSIDFQDLGGSGNNFGEFTHKGYEIWGNNRQGRNSYTLWWSWTSSGGGNGVLRLPKNGFNVANTLGKSSIQTWVTLDAKHNGTINDRQKKLHYAAISTSTTSFNGTYTPELQSSGNITGNTGFGTRSFNGPNLTEGTPCFGLASTFTSGAYYHFVRSIRIEYRE